MGGKTLDSLADTEVEQDIRGTTVNVRNDRGAVEGGDDTSHASLRKTTTTEDLHSVTSDIKSHSGSLILEHTNCTTKVLVLLLKVHVLNLVHNKLEPCIAGLNIRKHAANLLANNGLLNKCLAKDLALVGPLEALLCHEARRRKHTLNDMETLHVEVRHDQGKSAVLLAHKVLYRYLDVLKHNVGSSGRVAVRGLDNFCAYTLSLEVNEEH
mmetsp:Transcript_15687/g.30310  ORF Transcript_15687/g.30310 Transcript_15687/m.30310 type:complete len:211 (-) Transcript_15687:1114-1746(-)